MCAKACEGVHCKHTSCETSAAPCTAISAATSASHGSATLPWRHCQESRDSRSNVAFWGAIRAPRMVQKGDRGRRGFRCRYSRAERRGVGSGGVPAEHHQCHCCLGDKRQRLPMVPARIQRFRGFRDQFDMELRRMVRHRRQDTSSRAEKKEAQDKKGGASACAAPCPLTAATYIEARSTRDSDSGCPESVGDRRTQSARRW